MIKRYSLPIFGVLRVLVAGYVLLVPLEKPIDQDRKSEFPNQDRKSEFPNKPITKSRPDDSSFKGQNKPK